MKIPVSDELADAIEDGVIILEDIASEIAEKMRQADILDIIEDGIVKGRDRRERS